MRVVLITNLFPNSKQPGIAAYNLQQITALNRHADVSVEVIAPLPWIPSFLSRREIAYSEEIEGIKVYHPQYLVIPKILRFLYGIFFYFGIKTLVNKLHKEKPVDVVLSAWGWPDVFGSVLACKRLNVPVVANLLGSDINIHSWYFSRRIQMVWAFRKCQHIICKSTALKSRLIDMGLIEQNITVLLNGVDYKKFYPRPRADACKSLAIDMDKQRILFVGNFYPIKGVDVLIDAFSLVRKKTKNVELVLVGDGVCEDKIRDQIKTLNLSEDVRFVGRQAHDIIPLWFSACEIFCLSSRNEGCPNVVLEAVACGSRVVATDVGSVSEILDNVPNSAVVPSENHQMLADALLNSLSSLSKTAEQKKFLWPSWNDNADKLKSILSKASL